MSLNESIVEDAALEWFGELGYAVGHGPAPETWRQGEEETLSGLLKTGRRTRRGVSVLHSAAFPFYGALVFRLLRCCCIRSDGESGART